jgi:hypothetical protein
LALEITLGHRVSSRALAEKHAGQTTEESLAISKV